jgi:hypothetical protein
MPVHFEVDMRADLSEILISRTSSSAGYHQVLRPPQRQTETQRCVVDFTRLECPGLATFLAANFNRRPFKHYPARKSSNGFRRLFLPTKVLQSLPHIPNSYSPQILKPCEPFPHLNHGFSSLQLHQLFPFEILSGGPSLDLRHRSLRYLLPTD